MSEITLRLLGVAAAEIAYGGGRILIDAFNSVNMPPEPVDGDIVIFTHADGDHFAADRIPDLRGRQISVFGPPTIVLPMIRANVAEPSQFVVEYPETSGNKTVGQRGVSITFIQSGHFNGWKPAHVSFLLGIDGRKIYATGDSDIEPGLGYLSDVDCIICNLVDRGFLTKTEDPAFAIHHHLSYMLGIISTYKPRKIVANHLIDFEGTVEAVKLRKLVEAYGFTRIAVPLDRNETISIV